MSGEKLPEGWTYLGEEGEGQRSRRVFQRTDGARVWENIDESTARPWLAGHRRWCASGPTGSVDSGYIGYSHGRRRTYVNPIRWKSPIAAMAAVDERYPLARLV